MVTLSQETIEQLRRVYAEFYDKQDCPLAARGIREDNEWLYVTLLRDENFDSVIRSNGTH
jgi:ssDNA-specific exonuclease RecJ